MNNKIMFAISIVCSNIWAASSNDCGEIIAIAFLVSSVAYLILEAVRIGANHAE